MAVFDLTLFEVMVSEPVFGISRICLSVSSPLHTGEISENWLCLLGHRLLPLLLLHGKFIEFIWFEGGVWSLFSLMACCNIKLLV